VSPRAKTFWATAATLRALVVLVLLVVGYLLVPAHPWWGVLAAALVALSVVLPIFVMPPVRYRIHRWEVTPEAVCTRSGWLTREQRIAPLSRVQTVDSRQGALMRPFRLMSVTVTTASAAGPISIECLDEEVARRLVTELTERTSADRGDAT